MYLRQSQINYMICMCYITYVTHTHTHTYIHYILIIKIFQEFNILYTKIVYFLYFFNKKIIAFVDCQGVLIILLYFVS